jgi:CubicO group peptidase (beta-lactamase class C family)
MMKYRNYFLALLFLFLSCNHPATQTNPAVLDTVSEEIPEFIQPIDSSKIVHIDSLLAKTLKKYRFNGNALVALEGFPIFKYSNGYADLYQKTKLDYNTVFQIASVSKSFTAMAVLILHQRGKLNLDDTVKHYLPDFPFDNITIRQMMQHTAGMQNYMYYVDHHWEKDKAINNQDVLNLVNAHNPQLNFRPGRRHLYSNTGYAMLALLVEHVSGKPFYTFVNDEIFVPLRMQHTFAWNPSVIDTISNIATGFTRRGWRYRKYEHNPLDEVLGDKSIYTTAEDLLQWDRALYNNRLISDSLMQAAFTKAKSSRGREYDYGFGWRLKEIDGKKVVYHNGLWNGFTATLTRYVEDEMTIILLSNTNAPVASIVKQVYAVLKEEVVQHNKIALNNY